MTDHPICGPFQTAAEVSQAAAGIYDAASAVPVRQGAYKMLMDACQAAGIELGAEDHTHLAWLSKMEVSTCVVIAGLIRRAYLSGLRARAGKGAVVAPEGSGWISR